MKNFTHQLLIASVSMDDPRFAGSVIYIAKHEKNGTLGLIINQTIDVSVRQMLEELEIETQILRKPPQVLYGGPIRPDVGFVIHTGQPHWFSSFAVSENVCITTSKDVLDAIAHNRGVGNFQICLGHASWYEGQLEQEIANGDWYTCPADMQLLFELPYEQRWQAAMQKQGIDYTRLNPVIGHA